MRASKSSQARKSVSATEKGLCLSIKPAIIRFEDMEKDGPLKMKTLVIRNTSHRMQRVKLEFPSVKVFRVLPANSEFILAPGMSTTYQVECRGWDDTKMPVHRLDNIYVRVAGGEPTMSIAIHAFAATSKLEVPQCLQLGRVLQESTCKHTLSIKNHGKKPGYFIIDQPETPDVEVDPLKGEVLPQSCVNCTLILDTKTKGPRRTEFRLTLDGEERKIVILWAVFASSLDLINPTSKTLISKYDFGTVFYGSRSCFKLKVVNSSTGKVSISVQRAQEEGARAAAEQGIQEETLGFGAKKHPIHIFPLNESIESFGAVDLECWFKPKLSPAEKENIAQGFKNTNQPTGIASKKFEANFVISPTTEGYIGDPRHIHLIGKATVVDVHLSRELIDFGETPLHTSLSTEILLRNRNMKLAMGFEIERVSQFRFLPSKGILKPMDTKVIRIDFRPNNLGVFKHKVKISLAGGLNSVSLTLKGKCEVSAKKLTTVKGLHLVPEDFERKSRFINPDDPPRAFTKRKFARQKMDWKNYLTGIEANSIKQPGTRFPKENSDLNHTYDAKEYGLRLKNRTKYSNYLRSHPVTNKKSMTSRRPSKTSHQPHMGHLLDFAAGLKEPGLFLPSPQDELQSKGDSYSTKSKTSREGYSSSYYNRKQGSKSKSREKPLKERPTTQAEMRECETKIAHDDLLEIEGGPKTLDFGDVFVGSSKVKLYTVRNGLDRNIYIEMKLKEEAFRGTQKTTMMVPPKSKGVLPVCFSGDQVGEFRRAIYYVINNYLKLSFYVSAEVVPMSLGLSTKLIQFQFDPFSLDHTTTREVVLKNPSDIDATFWFTRESEQFTIDPIKGSVAGGGAQVCQITWAPDQTTSGTVEDSVHLHVRNGKKVRLTLIGSLPKAKVHFIKKSVKFRDVAVGGETSTSATMINAGKHPTAFKLKASPKDVLVEPKRGLLQPGDRHTVNFTYKPLTDGEMEGWVEFNLRGSAKPLRLPVKGGAVVPEIHILQEAFDFKTVEIGTREYREVTIENRSDVTAALIINFSDDRHFSLQFPPEWSEKEPYRMKYVGGGSKDRVTGKYSMNLEGNSTLQFLLQFYPRTVGNYIMEFPIKMEGFPTYPSLRRMILAKAKECKIRATPDHVTFGRQIVIDPSEAFRPYKKTIKLKSQESTSLSYKIFIGRNFKEKKMLDTKELVDSKCYFAKGNIVDIQKRRVEIRRKERIEEETHKLQHTAKCQIDADEERDVIEDQLATLINANATFRSTATGWKLLDDRKALDFRKRDMERKEKQKKRLLLRKKLLEENGDMKAGDISELGVWIDEHGREIFSIPSTIAEGRIDPGREKEIVIGFTPLRPKRYDQTLQILVGDTDYPYLTLPIDAIGYYRMLSFSSRELHLEVSPLQMTSSKEISVINHGYQSLDVRCRVRQTDENKLFPVKVSWPKGPLLSRSRKETNALVSFKGSSPMECETLLDFFDHDQNFFSVPLFGACDNCLLSTQVELKKTSSHPDTRQHHYLTKHSDKILIEKQGFEFVVRPRPERKYTSYQRGSSMEDDSDLEREAYVVDFHSGTYIWRSVHFALRLLKAMGKGSTLMTATVDNFPKTFSKQRGKDLIDFAAVVSGKPFAPPELERRADGKGVDEWSVLKFYLGFLTHLKSYGGLLSTVKPEDLLSEKEFVTLLHNPLYMSKYMQAELLSNDEISAERNRKISEFPVRSRLGWLNVIYQIFRCFLLIRVTSNALKTHPGFEMDEIIERTIETRSNIYSKSEIILLQWLEYHHNKIYPNTAKNLKNFNKDLNDGRVFGALILSTTPWMKSFFKQKEPGEDLSLRNAKGLIAAMRQLGLPLQLTPLDIIKPIARDGMLIALFLFINLPHFSPKATILFEVALGGSVTKEIELENPSKTPITYYAQYDGSPDFSIQQQVVSLAPRGKKGSKAKFPVTLVPRFSREVHGRLLLTSTPIAKKIVLNETLEESIVKANKSKSSRLSLCKSKMDTNHDANINNTTQIHDRGCRGMASALMFVVKSKVIDRIPIKTHTMETRAYELSKIPIVITNPSHVRSEMIVSIKSRFSLTVVPPFLPEPKKKPKQEVEAKRPRSSSRGRPRANSKEVKKPPEPDPETEKNSTNPAHKCPFWCKTFKVKLRPDGSETIVVSFLPFAPGTYTADVISLDDRIGEFVQRIAATVLPPAPMDPVSVRKVFNDSNLLTIDLKISKNNHKLDQARRLVVAELGSLTRIGRLEGAREKLGWCAGDTALPSDSIFYHVDMDSPFFTVPPYILLRESLPHGTISPLPGDDGDPAEPNHLRLSIRPTAPGVYSAMVKLTSKYDSRILPFRLTLRVPRTTPVIMIKVPARSKVDQGIPINNDTDDIWTFSADLRGKYFRGPQLFTVPPHSKASYPLSFSPQWICKIDGTLILRREHRDEKETRVDMREFQLKGKGVAPLPVSTVTLKCKAKETTTHHFTVWNWDRSIKTFKVSSDMVHVSGDESLQIDANSSDRYTLKFSPVASGEYKGSVSFEDEEGRYVWHAVKLVVSPPDPITELKITSEVNKAAEIEIPIRNLHQEEMVFEIHLEGENLYGEPFIKLKPGEKILYKFMFSPTQVGQSEGFARFFNKIAGEFVYNLTLDATSSGRS